jgi:hypothetical protein
MVKTGAQLEDGAVTLPGPFHGDGWTPTVEVADYSHGAEPQPAIPRAFRAEKPVPEVFLPFRAENPARKPLVPGRGIVEANLPGMMIGQHFREAVEREEPFHSALLPSL